MDRGGRGGRGRGRGNFGGSSAHGAGRVREFRQKPSTGFEVIEEDFRIQAQKALVEFRASDDAAITFPASLGANERRYVHHLCNTLGLESKSFGNGESRQLSVSRKDAKKQDEKSLRAPELLVNPNTEKLLSDHLPKHPPRLGDWRVAETIEQLAAAHAGHDRARRDRDERRKRSMDPAAAMARWDAVQRKREMQPDYKSMMSTRKSLPAWHVREQVTNALRTHQVVIVSGDTGCGKSTQVPQFILDAEDMGPTANMIVTQPRRISAISLAERVASERCEDVGSTVGYNVRLESSMTGDTQLLFCTTGVLLRRLTGDPMLSGVTHVIIDEVHERDVYSDFLLVILRDLIPLRPDLKVVIMSATLQLNLFVSYFTASLEEAHRKRIKLGIPQPPFPAAPAVVHVQGSTFPVTRYFLEDVLLQTGFMGTAGSGGFSAPHSHPGGVDRVGGFAGSAVGGGGIRSAGTSIVEQQHMQDLVASVRAGANINSALARADAGGGNDALRIDAIIDAALNLAEPASSTSSGSALPAIAASSKYAAPPETSTAFKCAMCNKSNFRDLEAFTDHTIMCFGPGTADDEGDADVGNAADAGAGQQQTQLDSAASTSAVPQAPTPLTSPSTPQTSPLPNSTVKLSSGTTLLLPGGAKAKLKAAAAVGGGGGATPASDGNDVADRGGAPATPASQIVSPSNNQLDPAIEQMLENYQKGIDDEDVDTYLLLELLLLIVNQSVAAGNRAPESPLVGTGSSAHAHGGRTPADTGLGAVLVFLPGWEEISRTMDMMRGHPLLGNSSRVLVLPLHSQVPTSEQRRVFKRPPPGVIKVILSTNIAETSVTIDDVVYVIDAGKVREKTFDAYTGCSRLTSVWTSQASSRQRAGRAGRVRPGIAYHLFSSKRHASMIEFAIPEMLRTPLDELCLQIKLLHLGSRLQGAADDDDDDVADVSAAAATTTTKRHTSEIQRFLSRAVQPPATNSIRAAVDLLFNIGALRKHEHDDRCGGLRSWRKQDSARCTEGEEELTPLGQRLAQLPVAPRLGKMILQAVLFRCLDPILTITCMMANRPPWVLPMHSSEKRVADRSRLALANGSRSDHIALLGAFNNFHEARRRGGGHPFSRAEQEFCRDNFVSAAAMNMVTAMRTQMLDELVNAGALSTLGVGGSGSGGRRGDAAASSTPGIPPAPQGFWSPGITSQSDLAILAAASSNSKNTALVLAVLAGGLYPNLARANPQGTAASAHGRDDDDDSPSKIPKMETRSNKKVMIHPSSINSNALAGAPAAQGPGGRTQPGGLAGASSTNVEWLLFDEMNTVGTFGTVALRGTTVVHPAAVLFMCGSGAGAALRGQLMPAGKRKPGDAEGSPVAAKPGADEHQRDRGYDDVLPLVAQSLAASDNDAAVVSGADLARAFEIEARRSNSAAAGGAIGDDGGDEDGDKGDVIVGLPPGSAAAAAPSDASFTPVARVQPLLRVDEWAGFTVRDTTTAVALSVLRRRLNLAFHRSVILPQAGADRTAEESAQDSATVELVARLLTSEVYGQAASNVAVSGFAGNVAGAVPSAALSGRPAPAPTAQLSARESTAGHNQQSSGRGGFNSRGEGRGGGRGAAGAGNLMPSQAAKVRGAGSAQAQNPQQQNHHCHQQQQGQPASQRMVWTAAGAAAAAGGPDVLASSVALAPAVPVQVVSRPAPPSLFHAQSSAPMLLPNPVGVAALPPIPPQSATVQPMVPAVRALFAAAAGQGQGPSRPSADSAPPQGQPQAEAGATNEDVDGDHHDGEGNGLQGHSDNGATNSRGRGGGRGGKRGRGRGGGGRGGRGGRGDAAAGQV